MATKLKRVYDKIDDVEEQFRPLYEEKDGKAIRRDASGDLEFEGTVPAKKLEEFRLQSQKDREDREAVEEKFKEVNLEEYGTLKGRAKELEEHKLIKKGDVDTVINSKVEERLKDVKAELQKRDVREAALKEKLSKVTIESKVLAEAVPFGLKKGAGPDLIERALKIFKVDDNGDAIAYEGDGKTPKHHLGDPYTIEQFVKDASNDSAKHLFEENTGGGGDHTKDNSGGKADSGINPWDPTTTNRKLQGDIMQQDFPKAKRLALKHGIVLATPVSFQAKK